MLRKALDNLKYIAGKVNIVIEFFVTMSLVFLFILTIIEVGGRYVFTYSFPWITEAAAFLLSFIVFFGVSCLIYRRSILSVKIFYNLFSPKIKKSICISAWILIVLYSLMLIRYGFYMAMRVVGQVTPSGYISLSLVRLIVPIGSMLILFQAIINLLEELCQEKA